MLKYIQPVSWSLVFLMLLMSLYLQAQKISNHNKKSTPAVVGASFLTR